MSFGLERISIRWRLALTSAALTVVILAAFAVGVYQVTSSRVRSDFNNEIAASVDKLRDGLDLTVDTSKQPAVIINTPLDVVASKNAVIRILNPNNGEVFAQTEQAPNLGRPPHVPSTQTIEGYRVEARAAFEELSDALWSDFGGRVYLVKNVHVKPDTLKAMYAEQAEEFFAIKAEVDPDGILRNEFLEKRFPELLAGPVAAAMP